MTYSSDLNGFSLESYGVKERHKRNLRKLSDYLKSLPADYQRFSMASYYELDVDSVEYRSYNYVRKVECGSVACAVGHGPSAGVIISGMYKYMMSWTEYARQAFGAESNQVWQWLFSDKWAETDDTIIGTANRIDWTLEHDVIPADYDLQMKGLAPLCYEPWSSLSSVLVGDTL